MCPFQPLRSAENAPWAEMYDLLQEEAGEGGGKPTTTSPNIQWEAISDIVTTSVSNHQLSSPSAHNECFPVKKSSVDPNTRKLFHNANERQRRKKLNALYSNLRSVLPNHANTKKKLSVPAVVCRVVKYIPQLRTQIENLSRQRDELLALRKISEATVRADALPKVSIQSRQMLPNVTIISAAASDLLLSILAHRARLLFSTILLLLEEERLDVLNVSTFVSDDKICYNLHLKLLEECSVDTEALRLKLLFLCD